MKKTLQVIMILALVCISMSCFVGCDEGFWNRDLFFHKHRYENVTYVSVIYKAAETDMDNFDSKFEGTRASLQELLINKGYAEATVVIESYDRIRVDVPSVDDILEILFIIGEPVTVSFFLTETNEKVLTGEEILNASAIYSPNDGGYVVSLDLTSEGQDKFFNATSNNINKTMDIVVTIGEESTTISSPTINSAISGNAIISGNFTADSAQKLADQINSGTFDVALELYQSDTVQHEVCLICGKKK